MKPASDELIRLLNEEVDNWKLYLADILPQAEAYQRDVERTRDKIRIFQDVLDVEKEIKG